MSYNSTGFNSIKTAWIRDLCKLVKTDFCSIQEHFISDKSAENYFKNQFGEYIPYVIPASRYENQDSGRARGGIAQLVRNRIDVKGRRVKTKCFRIQGQVTAPGLGQLIDYFTQKI